MELLLPCLLPSELVLMQQQLLSSTIGRAFCVRHLADLQHKRSALFVYFANLVENCTRTIFFSLSLTFFDTYTAISLP